MRRRDKTACIKADWRLFGVPIPQAFQIVRYLLVRPAGFFHTSWGYGPLLRRLFIHMKPTRAPRDPALEARTQARSAVGRRLKSRLCPPFFHRLSDFGFARAPIKLDKGPCPVSSIKKGGEPCTAHRLGAESPAQVRRPKRKGRQPCRASRRMASVTRAAWTASFTS